MQKTKTAMITLCGRPNVGKSSLTNALVGEKIAIVSNKPQTTRNRIYGVVTEGDTQLVLLDNFEPWATQMAVQRRNTRSPETKLESSGGLTLDVARDYARTGVDYIAVGGLTHSVTVLDLGLDIPT